jgi:hypothetical protein
MGAGVEGTLSVVSILGGAPFTLRIDLVLSFTSVHSTFSTYLHFFLSRLRVLYILHDGSGNLIIEDCIYHRSFLYTLLTERDGMAHGIESRTTVQSD